MSGWQQPLSVDLFLCYGEQRQAAKAQGSQEPLNIFQACNVLFAYAVTPFKIFPEISFFNLCSISL